MRQSDTSPCQCLQGTWLTDPGFECKIRALSVSLSSRRDSKRQNIVFPIMWAELTNVRIMKGWQPSHFSYYTPHSFFMPGILTPGRQKCMNRLKVWPRVRHSGFGWELAPPLPPSGCLALSLRHLCQLDPPQAAPKSCHWMKNAPDNACRWPVTVRLGWDEWQRANCR